MKELPLALFFPLYKIDHIMWSYSLDFHMDLPSIVLHECGKYANLEGEWAPGTQKW